MRCTVLSENTPFLSPGDYEPAHVAVKVSSPRRGTVPCRNVRAAAFDFTDSADTWQAQSYSCAEFAAREAQHATVLLPTGFFPSDPRAIAGYIQKRGISPDMQSSLPFETGYATLLRLGWCCALGRGGGCACAQQASSGMKNRSTAALMAAYAAAMRRRSL